MTKHVIRTMLFASLGATLAIAVPASAQNVEQFASEVRYGDLDLTTDAGVTQLQRRIRSAARTGCGHVENRDLKISRAAVHCRKAVISQAASKVELAVANARSGQKLAANAAIEVGTPVSR